MLRIWIFRRGAMELVTSENFHSFFIVPDFPLWILDLISIWLSVIKDKILSQIRIL